MYTNAWNQILLTLYNFWYSAERIISAEINDTDYSYYMKVLFHNFFSSSIHTSNIRVILLLMD